MSGRGALVARVVLVLLAAAVTLNAGLRLVRSVAGGRPSGPTSSSYATAADGLAAYADLLGRSGYATARQREPLDAAVIAERSTIVVLDPGMLLPGDAEAIRGVVAAGGRLIAGGREAGEWLDRVVDAPPSWRHTGWERARTIVPVAATGGASRIAGTAGVFDNPRGWLPLVWTEAGAVAVARGNDRGGEVVLLADASPLQNRLLSDADNAAFGLGLAGDAGGRVLFIESAHGYGAGEGVRAVPVPARVAAGGLALAGLVFGASRFRRMGPPQQDVERAVPPRRAYLDAVAAALSAPRRSVEAGEEARRQAAGLLRRRAALAKDAGPGELRSAALAAGLAPDLAEALTRPVADGDSALLAGRALASLHAGRWGGEAP